MLRQLARLTRPVPAAGPRALAIAIYADAAGNLLGAPGEGVACVDDAARAVDLLAAVWQRTGSEPVRAWAAGLLDFVLWMHQGEGRWVNFIEDWSGGLNHSGGTSSAGVNFWQARALSAAVTGTLVLGDERAAGPARLGLEAAAASDSPPDVRALHLLAQLRWLEGGRGTAGERTRAGCWADSIAGSRHGAILANSPDEGPAPHLWGHIQEAALVAAGRALDRPALVEVARASGLALFEPIIEAAFPLPVVQPYDVSSAIRVMDSLRLGAGSERFGELAELARAWFDGRNPAGRPVYDRTRGLVADGIDAGEVSSNSGAESNIEAGLALLEAATASASNPGRPPATGCINGL